MDVAVGWLLDTHVSCFGYHYCFFITQVSKTFSFGFCIKYPLSSLEQFLTTKHVILFHAKSSFCSRDMPF